MDFPSKESLQDSWISSVAAEFYLLSNSLNICETYEEAIKVLEVLLATAKEAIAEAKENIK